MNRYRWIWGIAAVAIALVVSLGAATSCSQQPPSMGRAVSINRPFEVGMNETVVVEPGNFEITLVEVNDSRCPSDVQCPWAGRVTTTIAVAQSGRSLGALNLALQATSQDEAIQAVDGHQLQLLDVNPHPISTSPTAPMDYTAQLQFSDS